MTNTDIDEEDQRTPIERPLLRSDLNDIRDIVHRMDQMLVGWYDENKVWRAQSDQLAVRLGRVERRIWLPALVSVVAAALAILARVAP